MLLEKYWPILKILVQLKNKTARQELLKILAKDRDFRRLIRSLCSNVYNKRVEVSPSARRKLVRYKGIIVKLCDKKLPKRKKQQLTVQSGGFLPVLIPLFATIIGSLLAK